MTNNVRQRYGNGLAGAANTSEPGPQQTWRSLWTPPAGDPFHAAPNEQDHPHACLNGYVYLGHVVLDPETGEETEEFALYLCRRCADSR